MDASRMGGNPELELFHLIKTQVFFICLLFIKTINTTATVFFLHISQVRIVLNFCLFLLVREHFVLLLPLSIFFINTTM